MSLIAFIDGRPQFAYPALRESKAVCGDGHRMRPKCGELVTWHWAHEPGTECSTCSEESAWHLEWKSVAHRLGCDIEVGMVKELARRRADIVAGVHIVELQHGYLAPAEIRAREAFYGPKLIWVYDAQRFAARMKTWVKDTGAPRLFRIKNPPLSLTTHKRDLYFDLRTIRQRAAHDPEWYGPPAEYAGVCRVRMWAYPSRFGTTDLLYGELFPPADTAEEFLTGLVESCWECGTKMTRCVGDQRHHPNCCPSGCRCLGVPEQMSLAAGADQGRTDPDVCPACDGPTTVIGAGPDGWVTACDVCDREWTVEELTG